MDILYAHRRPSLPEAFWTVTMDLDDANLGEALLHDADFGGVSLFRAVLDEAELMGVDFANADLSATSLINTELVNANLTDAALDRANLDGTLLSGSTLCGSAGRVRTRWPSAEVAERVASASAPHEDGLFVIGDLRLPSE